jgi:predicted DNA-binding antitoxin AbrB/MazE fold protein
MNDWACGKEMSSIKTYAVYKKGMLVLEDPVNLPEHSRVEVTIRRRFSEFVKKFGEHEAKEDTDQILRKNRRRISHG